MRFSSRFLLLAFLIVGLASASFAHGQSPAALDLSKLVKQLQEQIKLLQAQVNELKGQVKSAREDVATTREEVKNIREELNLTSTLRFGASGDGVKKVQEFLSQFPDIYPEKLVTGFYGTKTEAAIRKFQTQHGIEALGVIGPKTLAKINEVIRQAAETPDQKSPETGLAIETKPAVQIPFSLGASGAPSATTSPILPAPSAASSAATATTSLLIIPPPPSSTASTPVSPSASTPTPTPGASPSSSTTATAATTADTAPPTLSNVQATSTSQTTVVITWNTDKAADSKVEYGLTTAYEPGASDSAKVTSHAITLSATFQIETTYHYRVVSKDAAGNAATSPDYTFIVRDTTPPVVSGLQAASITETGVVISWTTDESAREDVYYAPSTPIKTSTAAWYVNRTLATSHTVTLNGLTAATTYYYIVLAKDANGNTRTSSEQSFTTATLPPPPPVAPAPPPIGYWPFDGNGSNSVSGGATAVAAGNAVFKTEGGKFGGYAYVPAIGDSVKIPYSSIFDLATSFTIEFWFRQRSNQSTAQDLVYKGTPINDYNFRIFRQLWNEYNFGPIITGYTAVNTGYWSQTSNPNQLSHGSWHHVAYTRDASASAYYLDGSLTHRLDYAQYPEYSGPARTPALDIIVGGTAIDTDIDNLRIYSSALTAGQVAQNMQTAFVRPKTADAELANIASTLARIAEEIKKLRGR